MITYISLMSLLALAGLASIVLDRRYVRGKRTEKSSDTTLSDGLK